VESTSAITVTETDWNEYRIEITRIAGVNTVEFFINDVLAATHNTGANIPDANMYLNFFVESDAAATAQLDIAAITVWMSDTDLGSFE
ncbi:MAG: hypothetical protein AABY22_24615, partial [Nanoarchaeota archaeon]